MKKKLTFGFIMFCVGIIAWLLFKHLFTGQNIRGTIREIDEKIYEKKKGLARRKKRIAGRKNVSENDLKKMDLNTINAYIRNKFKRPGHKS